MPPDPISITGREAFLRHGLAKKPIMVSSPPSVSSYRIGGRQEEFAWEPDMEAYEAFRGYGAGRFRLMLGGERGGAMYIA